MTVVPPPTTTTPPADALGGVCLSCGYDLRGLPEDRRRCPECGSAFDRTALGGDCHIPWVYRHRVGTWRAYWQTVWAVVGGPKAFTDSIPWVLIRYHGSESFRRMTVLVAAGAVVVLALVRSGASGAGPGSVAMTVGVTAAGAAAFLWFVTELRPFFTSIPYALPENSEQWFRAAVTADYACAGLALVPFPALVGSLAAFAEATGWWAAAGALWRLWDLSAAVTLGWWGWTVLSLFDAIVQPKPPGAGLLLAAGVLMLRVLMAGVMALIFVILPLVGFVGILRTVLGQP